MAFTLAELDLEDPCVKSTEKVGVDRARGTSASKIMNDPRIIVSPLSCQFTDDGITVDVQIYKLEDRDGWSLELVDEENNSTVWTDLFRTDEAAWQEFEASVRDLGLRALLEPDDEGETTVH